MWLVDGLGAGDEERRVGWVEGGWGNAGSIDEAVGGNRVALGRD